MRKMIQVGEHLPNIQITLKHGDIEVNDFFQDCKGLLIGVHGAFEPRSTQLVNLISSLVPQLTPKVALMSVVAINDSYVLRSWASKHKIPEKLTVVSDVNGTFTKRLGMGVSMRTQGFGRGLRSRLCVIFVEENAKVTYIDHSREPEVLVNSLVQFLKTIDILVDSSPLSRTFKNCRPPPEGHRSWEPIPIAGCQKSFYFEPKKWINPPDGVKASFEVLSDSFRCDSQCTIENNGLYLKINGLQGRIVFNSDEYELESVNYFVDVQIRGLDCHAELHMYFKSINEDEEEDTSFEGKTVKVIIPLMKGGYDTLLASMPNYTGGFPLASGYKMTCEVKDYFMLDNGLSLHFYNPMKFIRHVDEEGFVTFITMDCHGISARQVALLRNMLKIDSPVEKTSVEMVATTFYKADVIVQ